MGNNRINLSIESCFKQFDQSFNRVKYFSCIADALDTSHLPGDWVIKNETGFSYSVKSPEEGREDYLIQGYKHFVRCYLVRDCIETFALCLDNLFFILLLHGKTVPSNQTLHEALSTEEAEHLSFFRNKGLYGDKGKIKLLKKQFDLELSAPYKKIVSGLKDIRDCITHNNAIVNDRYGELYDQESRKFHWVTLNIFGRGVKSGKKVKIELGQAFEEETTLCVQLETKDHYKIFKIGDQLSFFSAEAYEIAWSLQLVGHEYLKEIQKKFPVEQVVAKAG